MVQCKPFGASNKQLIACISTYDQHLCILVMPKLFKSVSLLHQGFLQDNMPDRSLLKTMSAFSLSDVFKKKEKPHPSAELARLKIWIVCDTVCPVKSPDLNTRLKMMNATSVFDNAEKGAAEARRIVNYYQSIGKFYQELSAEERHESRLIEFEFWHDQARKHSSGGVFVEGPLRLNRGCELA